MQILTIREINDSMELELALDVFDLMESGVDENTAIGLTNQQVLLAGVYNPVVFECIGL